MVLAAAVDFVFSLASLETLFVIFQLGQPGLQRNNLLPFQYKNTYIGFRIIKGNSSAPLFSCVGQQGCDKRLCHQPLGRADDNGNLVLQEIADHFFSSANTAGS